MTQSSQASVPHAAPGHATSETQVPASKHTHDKHVDASLPARTRSVAPAPVAWYRRESWAVVGAVSFFPIGASLVAPTSWRVPLAAVAGVLVVAAIIMVARREGEARKEEEREAAAVSRD